MSFLQLSLPTGDVTQTLFSVGESQLLCTYISICYIIIILKGHYLILTPPSVIMTRQLPCKGDAVTG